MPKNVLFQGLPGLIALFVALPSMADTWPSDNYMKEGKTYTGAATSANLGVTSNTASTPVVANPWYRLDAGYYLKKNTSEAAQCPAGYYCPGVNLLTISTTSDQGATACPTNWTSEKGATAQTNCKRDISLDKNGGTLVSGKTLASSQSCNYSQSCSFPNTSGVLTAAGYTFNNKWSTNANCSDGGVTSASITSTNSSVKYYACKVGAISGQITVQYEVDGGPTPSGFTNPYPNGLYARYGTAIYASLSDANNGTNALTSLAVPELACYDFTRYTAQVNSQEVTLAYPDGRFFNDTITKLGNSAAGTGSTIIGSYNHYPIVHLTVPGFSGGANLTSAFNGNLYNDTTTCSTALHAGDSVGVPSTPGYTFGGYYCKDYYASDPGTGPSCNDFNSSNGGLGVQFVDASGKITQAGIDSLAGGANDCLAEHNGIICEAKLTANQYTITFNSNGGSGGQSGTKTATYDATLPAINTTAPTRSGYQFGGWYDTSASTGGTRYYDASGNAVRKWDKAANTTLYARWEAGVIYIKWTGVMPGVTMADESQQIDGALADDNGVIMSRVVYDGNISTPIMADIAQTGQVFIGWKFVKGN